MRNHAQCWWLWCIRRKIAPLTFDLVLNCLPVDLSNLPTPCMRSEADMAGS